MMRWVLVFALVQFSCASRAVERVTIGGREVAMWLPSGSAAEAGYPLVVFSHGFRGCDTQSIFLMEAFARNGYVVLAPNHGDAGCGSDGASTMIERQGARGMPLPSESFRSGEEWSEQTYRDRAEDIEAVLNAVLREKTWHNVRIDAQRIALAGHSLGGYTVLGLAGARPSWRDVRVKAVLALSPFCAPYLAKGDLGRLHVPVMYQGGTRDVGITPTVRRPKGAFDQSSPPKYYVEFNGAGHLAWTGLNPRFHRAIEEYSVAFLDRYLKPDTTDRLTPLLQKPFPRLVSDIRRSAD
jgi:predicted dienelactone hydrolase